MGYRDARLLAAQIAYRPRVNGSERGFESHVLVGVVCPVSVCSVGGNSGNSNFGALFCQMFGEHPIAVPEVIPDREEPGGYELADGRSDPNRPQSIQNHVVK